MRIAVALAMDERGRILLVRKRDTAIFMQPGGKLEAGESAATALCRELAEELAVCVAREDLIFLGQYHAQAAHEPGVTLEADVFHTKALPTVTAQAEIAECLWVDPACACSLLLAPLTRDVILPLAMHLQ